MKLYEKALFLINYGFILKKINFYKNLKRKYFLTHAVFPFSLKLHHSGKNENGKTK